MSVTRTRTADTNQLADRVPVIHTWLYTGNQPTPGDRALCGAIKQTHSQDPNGQLCVVCEELDQDDDA